MSDPAPAPSGTAPTPEGTARPPEGSPPAASPAPQAAPRPAPDAGAPPPDLEGGGFLEGLLKARVTLAFLLAAVAMIWLAYQQTRNLADFTASQVYADYAYRWEPVRDQQQWWRYFTGLYVSRQAIDALIYVYLFFQLAPMVEKALGSIRFSLLFLLAGGGGVAIAEVFDPGFRSVGTITAAYALLGSVPGLVLGSTGSLKRMLVHPSTSSAAFWVLLTVVIDHMAPGQGDAWSRVAAILLGLLLGAGFMFTRVGRGIGWPLSLLAAAIALGAVAASVKEVAWRDGKLGARGRPAGMADPEPSFQPPPPPPDPLGTPQQATTDADRARERVTPFLRRFGPLPTGTVPPEDPLLLSPQDLETAAGLLLELEKLSKGTNLVTMDLDPERVKLMILLGQRQGAARLAEDYADARPSPEARALAAAALLCLGGPANLDRARDFLEGALDNKPGLAQELPEVVYQVGWIYKKQENPVAAQAAFGRFLTLVGRDPNAQPPWRRPMVEHALAELGQ